MAFIAFAENIEDARNNKYPHNESLLKMILRQMIHKKMVSPDDQDIKQTYEKYKFTTEDLEEYEKIKKSEILLVNFTLRRNILNKDLNGIFNNLK